MDDVLRTMWPVIEELTDESDKNPASIYASLQALNLWQDTHNTGRALPGTEVTVARGREEALALANYACRFSFAVYGLGGGFFVNVLAAGGAKLSTMLDRLADDDVSSFCRDSGLPKSAVLYVSDDAQIGVPRHFVALDHENKTVVLAIRGSMSLADAFTDLLALNVPFCGGEAHKGIADSARAVYANTIGVITAVLTERQNIAGETWRLLVTGHSLGAGTSVLFTILLNYNIAKGIQVFPHGIPIQCVAFAPPPVFTAPLSKEAQAAFTTYDANAAAAAAAGLPPVPLPSTPLPTPEELTAVLPAHVQAQMVSWVHHDDLVSRLSLNTIRDIVRILTRIGNGNEEELSIFKRLYATHLPGSITGDSSKEVTAAVDAILRTHEREWLHKWYGIKATGTGTAALPAALASEDESLSKSGTSSAGVSGMYAPGPVSPLPVASAVASGVPVGAVGGAGSLPSSVSASTAAVAAWDPFESTGTGKPSTGTGTGSTAPSVSHPSPSAVKSALRQPPLVVPGSIYCFRAPTEWRDLVPYRAGSGLGHEDSSCLATPTDAPMNSVGKAAARVESAISDGVKTVSELMTPVAATVTSNVKSGVMNAFGALASLARTPPASAPAPVPAPAPAPVARPVVAASATASATAATGSGSTLTSLRTASAKSAGSFLSMGSSLISQAASAASKATSSVTSTVTGTGTGSGSGRSSPPTSSPSAPVASGSGYAFAPSAQTGLAAAPSSGPASTSHPSPGAAGLHISAPASATASASASVVIKVFEDGPLITRATQEQLSILPTTSRAWRDHLPDVYVHTLRHLRDVCRYQKTHGVDQLQATATGGTVAVASASILAAATTSSALSASSSASSSAASAHGSVPTASATGVAAASASVLPVASAVPLSPAQRAAAGYYAVMGLSEDPVNDYHTGNGTGTHQAVSGPTPFGLGPAQSPASTISTGSASASASASGSATTMAWAPL